MSNYGIKTGDRIYTMWFGKKEYATVTEEPRPSMLTPWHILVSVRYDNPIYAPQIEGERAHEACREINELHIDGENNE